LPNFRRAGDIIKAEIIVRFHDMEAGIVREVGEIFDVPLERFKKLTHLGFIKTVEEPEVAPVQLEKNK